MVDLRSLYDLEKTTWSGSELIQLLSSKGQLFLFAYSPRFKSLVSWSANSTDILGVKDIDIAKGGNLFLRHVHPDDRFLLMTDLERALEGKEEYRATYRWIKPNTDEVRWLHCRANLNTSLKEPLFEGFIIDLSDEVTGPISSFAGPNSVNTVLAAFSTMVIILDVDLRVLRINRFKDREAFNFGDKDFKHDQFRIGKPLLTCFSDQEYGRQFEREMRKIVNGDSRYYRNRVYHEDVVFSLEAAPLSELNAVKGLLITVSDITEVVRLERQLAELQKTEGLRLLAAGVSHNFNNCLQAIIGHASVINSHPQNKQLVQQASESIIDVVSRTSELAKHLYNLDDSPSDLLAPVDLNLAVMAAVNRIENLFTEGIKVAVAFGNPSPVMAKQEELVEAVAAILQNSKESLKDGGNISIKTFEVSLNELEVEDLKAGKYSKLVISDNGPGMSQKTKKRCMEPFYTTKNRDPYSGLGLKGEGLGLPSVFATVRNVGGAITVDSSQGLGTTISFFLPCQTEAQSADVAQRAQKPVEPPNILVVDDDRMVLETMKVILQDLGYRVMLTHDSRQAISILQKHSKSIQLVLLDAVMPGLNGTAVLKRMKKIKSNVVVIGFSGASPEITKAMLKAGAIQILRKPLGVAELKKALNQVFKARQAA